MESNINFKYYAFISYSHEDEEFAKLIQKKLTEYKLPSVIRKANPLLPENVRPIFRDVTNLTTGMLQGKLNSELEHSKFLIVLCSPNSAKPNDENKHWVNSEVQHFVDIGRAEYIIPIIVGGEPHAKNPEEECFCPALLSLPDGDELLGIDIRNNSKKKISFGKSLKRRLGIPDEDDLEEKGIVHIVAKMLGLNIDDLWDWNKKAQKRKAYTRLFTAAACFVVMLSAGLTIYFKKFHVYHEYYVDYVERAVQKKNRTDIEFIGLGKLSKKEIRRQERHFRFDYRDGKLRRIVYENSVGVPKTINKYDLDAQMIRDLEYNSSTGLLEAVLLKNETESVIGKYVYEQNGTVIDIKAKNGAPIGLKSKTTNLVDFSIWNNSADIKSYKFERNADGFVTKRMYFKSHGAETPACDADGIAGFEYILDDFGQPIETWYLGINKNSFVRQAARNGIAGFYSEYDENFHLYKRIYVNSNGKPAYNEAVCSGITMVIQDYKNGNCIRQSYYNENGVLSANSEGIAYLIYDYDDLGNRIRTSFYDKDGNYTSSKYGFAIEECVYDKKTGNCLAVTYFDSTGEPCITNDGFARIEFEYNSKNQIIEHRYYDADFNSKLMNIGYAKDILSYNDNGDIQSYCFFDNYGDPCYNSEGVAKTSYIYDDNHRIEEIHYYDTDFTTPIKCNDNYAVVIYKYDEDDKKLGNWIEEKVLDDYGNPVNAKNGICLTKRQYNSTGNLIEEFYYDLNNKVLGGLGYTYDEFGNMKTNSYYLDLEKNLCDNNLGYAYAEYDYDNKGNQIYIKKYNSKMQPISPYCTERHEYDDKNNKKRISYYNEYDKLTKNEHGVAEQYIMHNDKGKIIKQEFFDEYGKLVLYDNSHAIATAVYDSYGRKIEAACYNQDGKLYNNSAPYALVKYKYDSDGNEIEIAYYKNENELVCCENGFAIKRREFNKRKEIVKNAIYNEKEELIKESKYFFDDDYKLCIKTSEYQDGRPTHEVFDYRNNEKKELFYKDGKLFRQIDTASNGEIKETFYEE